MSSCGSTVITRKIEVRVPRPSARPSELMGGLVEIMPIRKPEAVIIEPEVKMVGKLWFNVSMTASL